MLDLAMGIVRFDFAGKPVWKQDDTGLRTIKEKLDTAAAEASLRGRRASKLSLRTVADSDGADRSSTRTSLLRIRLPGEDRFTRDGEDDVAANMSKYYTWNDNVPGGEAGPAEYGELEDEEIDEGSAGGISAEEDDPELVWDRMHGRSDVADALTDLPFHEPDEPGILTQTGALFARRWKEVIRSPGLVVGQAVTAVVFGVFVAIFYVGSDETREAIQARIGSFTLLLSFLGFSGLTGIGSAAENLALYARELRSGYYSSFAMFVTILFFDILLLRLLPTATVGVLSLLLSGSAYGIAHLLLQSAVLLGFAVQSALLAMAVSLVVGAGAGPSAPIAAAVAGVAASPLTVSAAATAVSPAAAASVAALVVATVHLWMLLFSGFVIALDVIPVHLRWMKFTSLYYYAFEAMLVNDLTNDMAAAELVGSDFT
ncbi:hypothetical protein HK405_014753, partial [Cladochytrium tenue]